MIRVTIRGMHYILESSDSPFIAYRLKRDGLTFNVYRHFNRDNLLFTHIDKKQVNLVEYGPGHLRHLGI